MNKLGKLIIKLLLALQPRWKARMNELMSTHQPRTREEFLKEFRSDVIALPIAEKLFRLLVNIASPLDETAFVPHLLDRIEDYDIVGYDVEELLFDLLIDYDLPKKGIHGDGREIVTVKDVIEFAVAVAHNYPRKSQRIHADNSSSQAQKSRS